MIFSILTLHLPGVEISMPPLTWEHWVLLVGASLFAYALAWLIRGFKIRRLRKAAIRREAEHAQMLADQKSKTESQFIEGQKKTDDAIADRSVLEQRLALHREASQRHEKDARGQIIALESELAAQREIIAQMESARARIAELEKAQAVMQERFATQRDADQRRIAEAQARIGSLEADLVAAREVSAQLQPTKARIGDLEAVVASERGRKEALEQMVTVTTQRAEDLETRLRAAQQQYAELNQDFADHQMTRSADRAGFEKMEAELAKLRETHASYQQQAETRIANLQRSVSAAEAKTTVVQKEFMGAIGVQGLPPSVSAERTNDKRVRDLEDRIAQIEAEGRKKAREDSYKIAELEYRLLEAHETIAGAQTNGGKGPPPLPPPLLPPSTQSP